MTMPRSRDSSRHPEVSIPGRVFSFLPFQNPPRRWFQARAMHARVQLSDWRDKAGSHGFRREDRFKSAWLMDFKVIFLSVARYGNHQGGFLFPENCLVDDCVLLWLVLVADRDRTAFNECRKLRQCRGSLGSCFALSYENRWYFVTFFCFWWRKYFVIFKTDGTMQLWIISVESGRTT